MKFIYLFSFSFISGIIFSYLMMRFSSSIGFTDKPEGIKRHEKEIPYGGGIAIFLSTSVYIFMGGDWKILILGAGVFLLGLLDDIIRISKYPKLIVQTLIAIVTVMIGIRMQVVFFPDILNIILSVIWIVGIINAFNIIDVMDGIAGGTGFFAASTFALIAIQNGRYEPLIAVSLAGGCAGFLPYNLPKAKIYMGDAGSYFIGYILAVISLEVSYTGSNPIALFVPLLILFFPIYDTIYVVILRALKGKNPLSGSRDHFVLKLRASGLNIPSIVAIIYLAIISLCEASYIITRLTLPGAVFVYSIAILISTVFGFILRGKT